jgi:GNAT superfamily N-acetyltransferase
MVVTIRDAELADMAALGILHLTCWREAYSHLLSPQFFDTVTAEDRSARWTQILGQMTPPEKLVLALEGDELVGFGSGGPSVGEAPRRERELYALYIRQSHYGTGLGATLLHAVIGAEPAQLWVAAENPRAIAFYAKQGFTLNGDADVVDFMEGMPELRMVR